MSDEADFWHGINDRSEKQRKEKSDKGFLSGSKYFRLSSLNGSLSDRLEQEADPRRDASQSVEYDKQGDNPTLKRGFCFPELSVWRDPVLEPYKIDRCYHCSDEGQLSLGVEKTMQASGLDASSSLNDIVRQGLEAEKMHPANLAAAEEFMKQYKKEFPDAYSALKSATTSASPAASTTSTTLEKPGWMDG